MNNTHTFAMFNYFSKNHQRAMDSMQASLEAEARAKAEALRIKKKLESDINELEIALDHSNKANAEANKSIKRYQGQLRDVESAYEEECRQRREIAEKGCLAERRANALQGELEESRALLDSADRGKKQAEMELAESRSAVNDMTSINSKAAAEKRHIESAVHTIHAEIDDMLHQAKSSEEKAKKAMVDAARLADELRAEQDHAGAQDKAKRILDAQIHELDAKLVDANDVAIKGGRNAMAKLESRIRELEIELGSVQSRTSETYKGFQKSERHIKELLFQQEEDHKNADRMTELAQKLQQKIKTYKKQIEEAEEIAALNLAKYRKAQQELEETEDRSKIAETQLTDARQIRGGSFMVCRLALLNLHLLSPELYIYYTYTPIHILLCMFFCRCKQKTDFYVYIKIKIILANNEGQSTKYVKRGYYSQQLCNYYILD